MKTSMVGTNTERLTKRREQLLTMLRHCESERQEIERNIDWIDQMAYEKRTGLLDKLSHAQGGDNCGATLMTKLSSRKPLCGTHPAAPPQSSNTPGSACD